VALGQAENAFALLCGAIAGLECGLLYWGEWLERPASEVTPKRMRSLEFTEAAGIQRLAHAYNMGSKTKRAAECISRPREGGGNPPFTLFEISSERVEQCPVDANGQLDLSRRPDVPYLPIAPIDGRLVSKRDDVSLVWEREADPDP
jgi:hypothetical protein